MCKQTYNKLTCTVLIYPKYILHGACSHPIIPVHFKSHPGLSTCTHIVNNYVWASWRDDCTNTYCIIFIRTISIRIRSNLVWVQFQYYLVNTFAVKPRKFEVLGTRDFIRIISSSNYREIDIKLKKWFFLLLSGFFSIKHKFWKRKRNVSWRRFFYAPKHMLL